MMAGLQRGDGQREKKQANKESKTTNGGEIEKRKF